MTVLELQEVTKVFSGRKGAQVRALDRVSFCIEEGESVGLIGSSGSGKSTVANAVCRFIDVTSGRILLRGCDITEARGKALRQVYKEVQMVFQSPRSSFDPRRTLGDGVGECLKNGGVGKAERRERVRALLERCGLPAAAADWYPHEVSGGQCQRAAIARALAAQPRLLVCDEATSALDVMAQRQILELLLELKAEGRLQLLFITHNLAVAQQCCDRLIVMDKGRIVEEGRMDDVVCRPQSEYTRRLIEAVLY
ncbi:ABC transporter ATP-binding protein [Megasphaera stantonii]|uniref:ABC transporter ATP-binding protein n=1 Tax=Megasphaera stantonii TaxID=2144175 RepID=A0A346B1C8_9FIRM|nr:dipeptide/oligopeptide/nickel ABC transporter ATP-binding protein [Megasphaera stantonii]AXL21921.1 ABC transporter ATP-binding protein [Megasphaera stantonii]